MPRGGSRPGAGRPKKVAMPPQEPAKDGDPPKPKGPRRTPLEYMLDVMNDNLADPLRRDRMAVAAAQYEHSKMGEGGKGKAKERAAEEAGSGKFKPAAPPKFGLINGGK